MLIIRSTPLIVTARSSEALDWKVNNILVPEKGWHFDEVRLEVNSFDQSLLDELQ